MSGVTAGVEETEEAVCPIGAICTVMIVTKYHVP